MSDGQGWDVDGLTVALAEAEAVIEGLTYENERLRAAVQAVRDLPVHWASLTTEMKSNLKTGFASMTVMQAVVRKADLDAALDGERDE